MDSQEIKKISIHGTKLWKRFVILNLFFSLIVTLEKCKKEWLNVLKQVAEVMTIQRQSKNVLKHLQMLLNLSSINTKNKEKLQELMLMVILIASSLKFAMNMMQELFKKKVQFLKLSSYWAVQALERYYIFK